MECPECSSEIRGDSHFCRVCGREFQNGDRVRPAHTQAILRSQGDLMIGGSFQGRYEIVEELGRGGMGVVYKAEDTKLRRHVALKFLPPELTRDPRAKERFVHEAQAASALDHPNICIVHEIDETDNGQIFISMGCYEGETLKEKIERGPLDVDEAVDIAGQVAEGLEEAHDRGIVHRDIKPSNIMVTAKGQAKIMDFGLAKLAGQTRITKAGTTMGTIAYMSPEQARGEDIDLRTDIWSLGVVFYELLTGEHPFKGEYDQAVIYSILNEDHRPVTEVNRDVPSEIGAIIDRCLKKGPDDRYQSAGELVGELVRQSNASSTLRYGHSRGAARSLGALRRAGVLRVGIPVAAIVVVALLVSMFPAGRVFFKRFIGAESVTAGAMKVGVLPCTMSGGNAADTAFCDGLARTLTQKLTLLERSNRGLFVLPEGEVQALEDKSPSEIRRVLGADLVLTGTLARSADAMTIRPVRIDFNVGPVGENDTDAFIERRGALITDPIANLSTWQDSIVVDLASLLGLEIGPGERQILFAHGTSVPEAYSSYQEGMGYLYPYRGTRDIDAAISAFGRAVAIDSSYVPAHTGLGNAYYLKGYYASDPSYYETAIAACGRALEKDSSYAYAHVVAGYAHYYADDLDNALDRFRQAIGIDTLCFNAYLAMGSVLCDAGDFAGAEAAYSRAAQLRPHVPKVYERLTYMYLAYQGKYLEAVRSASKTIDLKPNSSKGYSELGAAYYSLGRMDQARYAFEKSLSIDSTYRACANLGTIYFGQKRYADAARMYKAALGLGTSNYRVIGYLAEAYFWSPGQRDLAIETFGQAIELLDKAGMLDDTNPTQLSDLASYYARIGRSARSESLLVRAALLEPSEALILFRIADTYEQLGKRVLALDWLEKALEKGAPLETMDDFPGLREMKTDSRYRQLMDSRERRS